jgi:hypothetical protein
MGDKCNKKMRRRMIEARCRRKRRTSNEGMAGKG